MHQRLMTNNDAPNRVLSVRRRAPLKRALRGLALTVAVIGCLGAGREASASSGVITLLHVNDTHSHLDAFGPKDHNLDGTIGGMAKAAAVIAAQRAVAPDALLLHAGDAFQGTFFFNATFGLAELTLMQQLGFDAMAVGNHEFALGPGVLAMALATADAGGDLPLLSANLDISGYPSLEAWIHPSIMKEVEGVKVGIFGMTTPDNPLAIPAPVVILGAGDPPTVLGIAGQTAAQLRAAGADLVICLSHLGAEYDQAIAANVPGIDIIVGAHDHLVFGQPLVVTNPEGRPTLILQAGSDYLHVGRLRFTFSGGEVQVVDYALLPVDARVDPLPQVQEAVNGVKQTIVAIYGDVFHTQLSTALTDIETTTNPMQPRRDSGMGDLITDAFRAATGTDIAITADGLISGKIYRGPVVGEDLFQTVSYGYDSESGLGFKIATFDITGAELVKTLETTLAYADLNRDFFLQVSGMRFTYNGKRPPGERVILSSVEIGSEPLDPYRVYSVTVDEAAAMLIPMLGVEVSDLEVLPDLEYKVLRDYVLSQPRLLYLPEGRIREQSFNLRRYSRALPSLGAAIGRPSPAASAMTGVHPAAAPASN